MYAHSAALGVISTSRSADTLPRLHRTCGTDQGSYQPAEEASRPRSQSDSVSRANASLNLAVLQPQQYGAASCPDRGTPLGTLPGRSLAGRESTADVKSAQRRDRYGHRGGFLVGTEHQRVGRHRFNTSRHLAHFRRPHSNSGACLDRRSRLSHKLHRQQAADRDLDQPCPHEPGYLPPQPGPNEAGEPAGQTPHVARPSQDRQERDGTQKEKKRLAIDDDAIDLPVAQRGVGRDQRSIRHRQERAQASGRTKYDHFGVWLATSR